MRRATLVFRADGTQRYDLGAVSNLRASNR